MSDAPTAALVEIRNLSKSYVRGDQVIPVLVDINLDVAAGDFVEVPLGPRKVLGVVRSTFLVSPDARIAREWRGVKVPGHAQAVLEALQAEAAQ